MNSELKYIDGKFLRGGIEVKPVFGDGEQLRLLNQLNEIKDLAQKGKYALRIEEEGLNEDDGENDGLYHWSITFTCVCGRNTYLAGKDIEKEPQNQAFQCLCGQGWKSESSEESEFEVVFKMIKR